MNDIELARKIDALNATGHYAEVDDLIMSNVPPPWACKRCGDSIGYLGRFIEWLLPFRMFHHDCRPKDDK